MRFAHAAGALALASFVLLAACSAPSALPQQGALQFSLHTQAGYTAAALPAGFFPYAIMRDGQIAGNSGKSAAIYSNGSLTLLPQYAACARGSGEVLTATSVNKAGSAVGYCAVTGTNGVRHAFALYWHGSVVRALAYGGQGTSGEIDDMSINNSDTVVGVVDDFSNSNGGTLAHFYLSQHIADQIPNGAKTYAVVLGNNARFAYTASDNVNNVYSASTGTLSGQTVQLFPTLGASFALWTNDGGGVAGYYEPTSTSERAFLYIGGRKIILAAKALAATGINNAGAAIGILSVNGGTGIYRYSSGALTDITNSISPAGDYTLTGSAYSRSGALLGYSDGGDLIAYSKSKGQYYIVSPDSPSL